MGKSGQRMMPSLMTATMMKATMMTMTTTKVTNPRQCPNHLHNEDNKDYTMASTINIRVRIRIALQPVVEWWWGGREGGGMMKSMSDWIDMLNNGGGVGGLNNGNNTCSRVGIGIGIEGRVLTSMGA
jgi:hypothetical protein